MTLTKPVRLSGHARSQLARRGVTADEVTEAIHTSDFIGNKPSHAKAQRTLRY